MIIKRPLNGRRLRSALPRGFGWIDHRFLRHGYFSRLSQQAVSLYSLLACASDLQGLSYYSDGKLAQCLGLSVCNLTQARRELLQFELIAYQKPIYQVLTMEDPVQIVLPLPEPPQPPQPRQPRQAPAVGTSPEPAPAADPEELRPRINLKAMVEAAIARNQKP